VNFFDADRLACKEGTEINFLAAGTGAATTSDDNDLVVKRIIKIRQSLVDASCGLIGLGRAESQSPKRPARSNLDEIPRYFRMQQLFPISSSSSPHGPDLSAFVPNSQVTSGLPVTRGQNGEGLSLYADQGGRWRYCANRGSDSVVQVLVSRPGHFASIRRLPN
jgi:hypothetical protein